MQSRPIKLGTRGSPLALAQAHEVRDRLVAAHGDQGLEESKVEIKVISTSGDQILDKALREVGGKGLFTKEIEEALLCGEIDAAVHSMKDMETQLPGGLAIGAILPREDVRDAFISLKFPSFDLLPEGAVVGTSSLRRQAQVKRLRPDLDVVDFRGNVQTRLRKLEEGVADATFLACAGLNRLGLSDKITKAVATEAMLPAVAQGAIGIEIREDDERTRDMLAPLNDADTALCVEVERAFLAALDGSCRTPIAGLAVIETDNSVSFQGLVLTPDGSDTRSCAFKTARGDACNLATQAGRELLESVDRAFFEMIG